MGMYCVNCQKNAANENSSVSMTKQDILILLSNCVACSRKKSRFLKKSRTAPHYFRLKKKSCFNNI